MIDEPHYRMKAKEEVLQNCALPDGICLFEIQGQSIFPMYGASGGLTPQWIAYLWKPGKDQLDGCDLGCGGFRKFGDHRWYGIRVCPTDSSERIFLEVEKAIESLKA